MDFQKSPKKDGSNSGSIDYTQQNSYQRHGRRPQHRKPNYSFASQRETAKPIVVEDFVSLHKTPLISESTHKLAYTSFGMYANLCHSDNREIINQKILVVKLIHNYKKVIQAHNIKYSAINKSIITAYNFLATISKQRKNILIVGIRKYIRDYVSHEAVRAKSFYVTNRWLGGMLTNLLTVRKQIRVMTEIEKDEISGALFRLSKNEVAKAKKKYKSLQQIFGGILVMNSPPDCVVVLCPRENKNAIKEAQILNIPIVALINTGDSPRGIDYPIYCNNFYKKSLYLFTTLICDAIVEGSSKDAVLKFAFQENIDPGDLLSPVEVKEEKLRKEEAALQEQQKGDENNQDDSKRQLLKSYFNKTI